MRLEKKHWDRALDLVEQAERNLPLILDAAASVEQQSGANLIVLRSAERSKAGVSITDLTSRLTQRGMEYSRAKATVEGLVSVNKLILDAKSGKYHLVGDLEDYL